MKTQIYVDDRCGNIYEIPHGQITLKRARNGRAASMEFEYYEDSTATEFPINTGYVVLMKADDIRIFYGYVFKVSMTKITCYDQLRYLKFKDSKVFENKTLTEIVNIIAGENLMLLGNVADTKYVIPKQVSDNTEYLDMIVKGIETTLLSTGRLYFIQDNVGFLELMDIDDTKLDILLDGNGNITDYDITTDIDTDTYNCIKLLQDKKKTEPREYAYQDSANIAKWGKLQYFEVVDEKYNMAQINEKGNNLLKLKNREKKTFKLKNAIGDIRCRSGYSVYINMPEQGIDGWYLIDSDTHKFNDNEHTMDLELVVVNCITA